MVELLEGFDLNGTIVALRHVEEKYSIRFSYDGSLYATFLIAVGILNARRRWYVQMKPLPKCKTDSTYNEMICMELQDKLEEYYEITLPKEEQEWLTFVIAITEIQEFGLDSARQKCEIMNNELCRLTLKVITLASDITNIDLRKDTFLASRLFLDLKAMIERMKYKAYFKNALLKQVKQKYPVIYAVAWSISVLFDKELGLDINEDEIGYLALQIGGAIERNSAVLKACIVCNYGFGISQMLTEKVERSISDIEIVEILSNRDVRKIQTSDCDFIISTLDLKEIDCNKECVVVEHLLLPYDINNIEMRMRQIRKERLSNQSASQRISLSKHLFKSELMCLDVETSNKRRLLQDMCTQLESQGYVTTEFEQSVLEREEITSTEVGKGIALAHGYARYVIRPIIAVATLREPIIWAEGEKVDMVFLLAFDLKESMGMRNEIVRFYKSFAAFLENDNAVSQMKSCTEVDEMEKLLNEL
jgi:mannitol/fructose-specific phosphotransferase system IIA component (Ntr-type)/galactitol-specific phosphotransferase system IIB component